MHSSSDDEEDMTTPTTTTTAPVLASASASTSASSPFTGSFQRSQTDSPRIVNGSMTIPGARSTSQSQLLSSSSSGSMNNNGTSMSTSSSSSSYKGDLPPRPQHGRSRARSSDMPLSQLVAEFRSRDSSCSPSSTQSSPTVSPLTQRGGRRLPKSRTSSVPLPHPLLKSLSKPMVGWEQQPEEVRECWAVFFLCVCLCACERVGDLWVVSSGPFCATL